MAYAPSFAPEFFFGDGDLSPEELPRSNRPTSVCQALRSLTDQEWAALARDVFGVSREHLDIETVVARIQETNTCGNLDSPVEVFVDADGWYRLLVFDRKECRRAPRSIAPAPSPAAEETPLHD